MRWVNLELYKIMIKMKQCYNNKKRGGEKMTIEEKIDIVSKIFAALEVVPQNQKDQLAGIIIGYSMANQMKEAKGG